VLAEQSVHGLGDHGRIPAPWPKRSSGEATAQKFAVKFIGTSGRTAAGAKLLGTVANKVLHIASAPVVLAR